MVRTSQNLIEPHRNSQNHPGYQRKSMERENYKIHVKNREKHGKSWKITMNYQNNAKMVFFNLYLMEFGSEWQPWLSVFPPL